MGFLAAHEMDETSSLGVSQLLQRRNGVCPLREEISFVSGLEAHLNARCLGAVVARVSEEWSLTPEAADGPEENVRFRGAASALTERRTLGIHVGLAGLLVATSYVGGSPTAGKDRDVRNEGLPKLKADIDRWRVPLWGAGVSELLVGNGPLEGGALRIVDS